MALRLPMSQALDRRVLVGVGLAAAAAGLVLIISRPPPTYAVLVAGSDLPAGTPIGELDVEVRHIEDAGGHVEGTSVGELSDWTLRVPLTAGEPLLPSLLVPPEVQTAPNLIALELESSHAVLGGLSAGDEVDVYVTQSGVGAAATTELIAHRVYVVDARLAASSVGGDRVELLLAVDDNLAGRLAAAARSGGIDLVRIGP